MKRFSLLLVLSLTGCGGPLLSPTQSPEYHRPLQQPSTSVVIIGDSVVNAWCAGITLPSGWVCEGSPASTPQETTAQVLSRFGNATALHPKTIVIEAGVWDMANLGLNGDNEACPAGQANPCDNVSEMVQQGQAAGAQVVVCTIPPWGYGPMQVAWDAGYVDGDGIIQVFDIGTFNTAIMAIPGAVDMNKLLIDPNLVREAEAWPYIYNPLYTTDGVTPNAAGAQVMTTALQAAITKAGIQ